MAEANETKYPMIAVKKLQLFDNNPRTITRATLAKLAKSIEEEGFIQPIVVDEQNRIIAGEQRVKAAKKLKMKAVPFVRVDLQGDDQRARVLNLRLNKIQGEFDFEKLYEFIGELDSDSIEAAGFDHEETEEIMQMLSDADEEIEKLEQEADEKTRVSFEASAAKNKTQFKFGNLKTTVDSVVFNRLMVMLEAALSAGIVKSEADAVTLMCKLFCRKVKGMVES